MFIIWDFLESLRGPHKNDPTMEDVGESKYPCSDLELVAEAFAKQVRPHEPQSIDTKRLHQEMLLSWCCEQDQSERTPEAAVANQSPDGFRYSCPSAAHHDCHSQSEGESRQQSETYMRMVFAASA